MCRGNVCGGPSALLLSPGWLAGPECAEHTPGTSCTLSTFPRRPQTGEDEASEASWCGTPEQGSGGPGHVATGSILAWTQGPTHSRGDRRGSSAAAPLPARLVSRHSEERSSAGAWVLPSEAVQSLREERAGWREGASPQVRRAVRGRVRTPRSGAGSSLSPFKNNTGGFPYWGAQESLSPTQGQGVWGSGHLPTRASSGGEHAAVMGSTQRWQGAPSGDGEGAPGVAGSTQL